MTKPVLNMVDKAMWKNRTDLARQVMLVVKRFTQGRPMPESEVIATLAFCVGLGIGNQPPTVNKHELMRMAATMVTEGEDAASHGKGNRVVDNDAIRASQI